MKYPAKQMIDLQIVKRKIEQALPGSHVEVKDFSQGHAAHHPTGDHLQVNVAYSGFKGKTLLEKHRIIYDILQEEMKEQIHALRINVQD